MITPLKDYQKDSITSYKELCSCRPQDAEELRDSHSPWLFIGLSYVSWLLIVIVTAFLIYLVYPRFVSLHIHGEIVLLVGAIGGLTIIGGGLTLIYLTVLLKKDLLYPHGEKSVTVKVLYPINSYLAKLIGINRKKVGNSFVEVNNRMINALAKEKRISAKKILILLPHCIQLSACQRRVTNDINNCISCGKCDIKDVLALKEKYNLEAVSVATGGTLARKIIIETKPTLIIAVACERDLVSGIQDAYPIPVYGILNIRLNGPCHNTIIPIDELENIIKYVQEFNG